MILKPLLLLVIGSLGAVSSASHDPVKHHKLEARACPAPGKQLVIDDSKWPGYYCRCGLKQSPVNIITSDVVQVNMKPLRTFGFYRSATSLEISNSGSSVKVKPIFKKLVVVTGGILKTTKYYFDHFHFHWDNCNSKGSEHEINGKRSAMEAHFVFFQDGVHDPVNTKGAVVVLTVLYKLGKKNKVLQPVVDVLKSGVMVDPHDTVIKAETKYRLRDYLPTDMTKNYYTYKGSLSTPNCTEGTRFIIYKQKLGIHKRQIKAFNTIRNAAGKRIKDNCRPIKPLNGRVVNEVRYCDYSGTSSECNERRRKGGAKKGAKPPSPLL